MKNANNSFGSLNGSANFYRYQLGNFQYTDGVKELAESCNAFWLIDLIVSHQTNSKVQKQCFQVWELRRLLLNKFMVLCTNGNHYKITCQYIPFSDFPFDTATIWLVNHTLLLPNEY
jgi:hypothetical protein